MAVAVEERLAYLEGRVGEQSQMINGIREALTSLEQRMDRRLEAVEQRFTSLEDKLDRRFEVLERTVDERLTALDRKLDARTDALDAKLAGQFLWLVGVQVTTFVAIVAAVLAR